MSETYPTKILEPVQSERSAGARYINFFQGVEMAVALGTAIASKPFFLPQETALPPNSNYSIPFTGFDINFSRHVSAGKNLIESRSSVPESLNKEFQLLVKKWREETFFISSLTKQFNHPAYLRIIAMGKEGVPLVLREMKNSQDSWFYALKFMTGEDVSFGIKDFEQAKMAWLEWGHKNNYI